MTNGKNMNDENIIIEKVLSDPERSAHYLEKCCIYITIRNKAQCPVQIEKVECLFQYDNKDEQYIPFITPFLTLESNNSSRPLRIEFEVDLVLQANSNFYQIVVHYRDDSLKKIIHDPHKYIVFNQIEHNGKMFFISHKDDEDTYVSRRLAGFLKKLGFIGYLSEDDHRPGMDLWREKIPEAIKSSVGIIILWTSNAAARPTKIKREIKIAKSSKKRLILIREKGVRMPLIFPKKIEWYTFEGPISMPELKKIACAIEADDRRGAYSC